MGLAKRIIPCLDVAGGRVVKGVNFINIKDAGDPVEIAKQYDAQGADELVFLDISATHENRGTLIDMVEAIANHVFIPLTVGGGVKSLDDIKQLLNAGADKVAINSAAISQPELVSQAANFFGSQCIVIAIDAKQTAADNWQIFTHGGRKPTGIDAIDWAVEMTRAGAGEVLLTSMDKDGTKSGFDLALTQRISRLVSVPVIASGGVGTLEHLVEGVLEGEADAVLAASIFHFGQHTISETKHYMHQRGIEVRL